VNAALINGAPGDRIDCTDRGLQYGDGLFETIRCQEGRARWLDLHLQRLQRGLARLRIAFHDIDALRGEIQQLAAGDRERCLVKVIVTRGSATRRGYAPAGDEKPTRVVSRHPWPTMAGADEFRVGLSAVRLSANPLLAGLKHLNRLEQVMAQMACVESGLSEVLMLSATPHVISGSMSNVFFVLKQQLVTPELRDSGVEGVMRQVVLNASARLNIEIQVRAVGPQELIDVREAFVTNVRLGVQSVHWLDGRTLVSDAYAQQLRRQVDASTD
jgi:4-amino-4-deoxychorismate lyase